MANLKMPCLLVLLAVTVLTQAKEAAAATKAESSKRLRHRTESEMMEDESNNIDDYVKQEAEPERSRKIDHNNDRNVVGEQRDSSIRWFRKLQEQLLDQSMRQQMVEKDHILTEKWLVDNINDLHRELKQTETDLEHYVQVTKNILAQNEAQLRQQQLASALSQTVPSKLSRFHRGSKQQDASPDQTKWQIDSLRALVLSEIAKQRG